MANKPPVCEYSGTLKQLQSGDTLDITTLSTVNNLSQNLVASLADLLMEQQPGTAVNNSVAIANVIGVGDPRICDFRLSAASSTPITTTDQTSVGTLYFVPQDQVTGTPSVRNTTTASGSTAAVVSVPTHATGDLMVALIAWDSVSGSPPGNASWTTYGAALNGGIGMTIAYRFATASEPASYTWTSGSMTVGTLLAVQNGGVPEAFVTPGAKATPVVCTNTNTLGAFRLMLVGIADTSTTTFSIHSANGNYTDVGFVSASGAHPMGQQVGTWAQAAQGTASTFNVTPSNAGISLNIAIPAFSTGRIALYNTSTGWQQYSSTQVSLALTATSGSVYDVFAYWNTSSPNGVTLESLAWTNTTTRATALATLDGVLVKSTDSSRRYLGTFYANGTNLTEDSAANRLIWNQYNRVPRNLVAKLPTNSDWTYTTATWRAANNSTTLGTYAVSCVIGNLCETVCAQYSVVVGSTTGAWQCAGIGINSTSVNSAQLTPGTGLAAASAASPAFGIYEGNLAVGYSTIQALEISQAAGTATWNWPPGGTFPTSQGGISGRVWA